MVHTLPENSGVSDSRLPAFVGFWERFSESRYAKFAVTSQALTMRPEMPKLTPSTCCASSWLKIGGTAVNRVETWQFADYDDDDKLVEQASTNPPTVYGFGHEAYYHNVLAVLRGEAPPETDGRAGRKSLELILGICESARTGREVPIPLRIR